MRTVTITLVSVASILAVLAILLSGFPIQPESDPKSDITSDSFARYDLYPSTCNNLLGKPDADCFIQAFESCKPATIKSKSNTVEGDPVFSYARIVLRDGCNILFVVDDSLDRYGHNSLLDGVVCTDARISDQGNHIVFLCPIENHGSDWAGMPLY